MQEQEKELFAGYEIKNWEFSPRVYKIIGASAILNLLFVIVMAQGNLLTRKGCDSPFVSSICQVLDTVYLGSALLGTDSEFVSKEYQKSALEDADITYIDVSNDAPLKYPEGYFALANPEQAMMQDPTMMMPGDFSAQPFNNFSASPATPPASGSDLLGSAQNLPPVNPNPVVGDLPTSTGGANPIASNPYRPRRFPRPVTPRTSRIPNDSPKDLPKLGGEETAANKTKEDKKPADANQKPIESEKVAEVEINKKPFEDLGDSLNDKLAKKEIDLSKPFFVVLDGTLKADGKLDTKKSRFVKYEGDEQMVNVAKDALQSIGDSGFLGYLKNIGVDRVNFTLVQDDQQIYAIIVSDQKTPEKAATTSSGFNTMLSTLRLLDANGVKSLDENSKIIVNNSKVTTEGKSFVLKFAVPKAVAQDLIDRSLKQRAEKKNNSQTDNSNGISQNSNAKTAK